MLRKQTVLKAVAAEHPPLEDKIWSLYGAMRRNSAYYENYKVDPGMNSAVGETLYVHDYRQDIECFLNNQP